MFGPSLKPAVPLKLVRLDGTMTPQTYGLLDTGADTSQFPAAWAAVLGIDLAKDCQDAPGTTAGGTTTNSIYSGGMEAIVMGTKVKLAANFNRGLPIILLGRDDFLAYYTATFEQAKKRFTLEEISPEAMPARS